MSITVCAKWFQKNDATLRTQKIKNIASEHGILDGWETTFILGQKAYFQWLWLLASGKIQVVFFRHPIQLHPGDSSKILENFSL